MQLKSGKKYEFNWFSKRKGMSLGGIRVIQLGTDCCEPGYIMRPHSQWCYEINYIVSGSCIMGCGETKVHIHQDEIFIPTLNAMHTLVVDIHKPLHYCYIGFAFENEYPLANDLAMIRAFFEGNHELYHSGNQELLLTFFRAINELVEPGMCSNLLMTGYVHTILTIVMRTFLYGNEKMHLDITTAKSTGETIYLIMKTIDDHLAEIKSIAELAEMLGYHPCYLSHHFRERVGMTLQEYLTKKKIERSIALMRFSPLSITEISERMSYATLQSFSRAFKRVTGLSPSAYISKNISQIRNYVPMPAQDE